MNTREQKIFVRNLKKLMQDYDLYQYELADMLGINRSVLNETLNLKNVPTLHFVYAISNNFKTLSLDWLLKGDGEQWHGRAPKILKGAPKSAPRVAQLKT